ncbi:hypothetical protein HN928_01340, partial [bacterium]|nr:hypothetical protein [bacterium]
MENSFFRILSEKQRFSFSHYLAAELGYEELVQVLHRLHLIDLDGINPDGRTALHLAVMNRHEGVVATLLDLGADPTIIDASRQTALHLSVGSDSRRSLNITKRLLRSMGGELSDLTPINQPDSNRNTPLHVAAGRGKLLQTRLLIKKGADREAVNADEKTPQEMVHENERLKRFLTTPFVDSEASDTDSEDESDYEYKDTLYHIGENYFTRSQNLVGQLPLSLGGERIRFREEWIAADETGNCGFIGLGTDREVLANTLVA